MTPREIVDELDRHIVGQHAAKRAVADRAAQPLAPQQLPGAARRGHAEEHPDDRPDRRRQDRDRASPGDARQRAVHEGRSHQVHRSRLRRPDVERIDARPADTAVKHERERKDQVASAEAEERAEDRILDALLPPPRSAGFGQRRGPRAPTDAHRARRVMRKQLRERRTGRPRDRDRRRECNVGVDIMAPPGMEEMGQQLPEHVLADAARASAEAQAGDQGRAHAACSKRKPASWSTRKTSRPTRIEAGEQHGIVFIDEIDKVAGRRTCSGADVSREGVQRDLLPLVEGTHRQHQVRLGEDRPHPVHRLGCVPPGQAARPDAGTAGPLPDPRRAGRCREDDFVRILTEPKAR